MSLPNFKQRQYYWQGITAVGEKKQGVMQAESIATLRSQLRREGILLKKSRKSLYFMFNRHIKQSEINIFIRQLASLIKAGISLIEAFDLIIARFNRQTMKVLIQTIKTDLETGLSLAKSLEEHPKYFNCLFCGLVDAGEQSGTLEILLDYLCSYQEKTYLIKKRVKKILTYPLIVLIFAFLVTAMLLIFAIPQFEALYKQFSAELPLLTKIIIQISNFIKIYGLSLLVSLSASIYGLIYLKNRCYPNSHWGEKLLLRSPIIGAFFIKTSTIHFSHTLAVTFGAGLPLVSAINLVAKASGNSLYAASCYNIAKIISTGQSLEVALTNNYLFPQLVIQMTALGEKSGTLEQMLKKIAWIYEEELDNTIDQLESLLEPSLMLLLALFVGCLIFAMYLPIFKLGTII